MSSNFSLLPRLFSDERCVTASRIAPASLGGPDAKPPIAVVLVKSSANAAVTVADGELTTLGGGMTGRGAGSKFLTAATDALRTTLPNDFVGCVLKLQALTQMI